MQLFQTVKYRREGGTPNKKIWKSILIYRPSVSAAIRRLGAWTDARGHKRTWQDVRRFPLYPEYALGGRRRRRSLSWIDTRWRGSSSGLSSSFCASYRRRTRPQQDASAVGRVWAEGLVPHLLLRLSSEFADGDQPALSPNRGTCWAGQVAAQDSDCPIPAEITGTAAPATSCNVGRSWPLPRPHRDAPRQLNHRCFVLNPVCIPTCSPRALYVPYPYL